MSRLLIKILIGVVIVALLVFLGFYVSNRTNKIQDNSTYKACGCGCCPDVKPIEQCLYKKNGDNLESVIQKDVTQSKSTLCDRVGCSLGTLYKYCD